jgi:hypothetical protein
MFYHFCRWNFSLSPETVLQLVTIHGLYREVVIPLCFCLTTGKSLAQYRHLLLEICIKMRGLTRRRWRPNTAICDFELALILALETELPGIRVRGCYFHFSQSLWRKFASLGLVSQYRAHSADGRRLRKFVQKNESSGFSSRCDHRQYVQCLLRQCKCAASMPHISKTSDYINYIRRVYIAQTASFRPPMWSVYDRGIYVRTNNFVER